MRVSARAVPVLMLHGTGHLPALAPHRWLQRLSTPPELLEAMFDHWKRAGYATLSLDELADFVERGRDVPKRCLALTLDDGYLDNWVALEPLLRRYDFRATVFVSTDFVDPRAVVRPTTEEVRNPESLTWKGYLSWDEMRRMEQAGAVSIGSHARSHTWYFVSDRIVDYYRPGNALTQPRSRLRFLWLNANESRKPFALDEMTDASIPWGTPIYEYAPAIVARRFVPHPGEADTIVAFVAARGGATFFDAPAWKDALDAEVRKFRSGGRLLGDYETESERAFRVRDEIEGSRRILAQALGREIAYFSFPQGARDDASESIVREAGYRMWTRPSSGRKLNRRGTAERHIYRCGSGFGAFGERRGKALQVWSQRLAIEMHAGSRWARLVNKAVAAGRIAVTMGRP
jgi:peptidoglycan/xylan/chitin deacetylase (PgdA/CDA1 family)